MSICKAKPGKEFATGPQVVRLSDINPDWIVNYRTIATEAFLGDTCRSLGMNDGVSGTQHVTLAVSTGCQSGLGLTDGFVRYECMSRNALATLIDEYNSTYGHTPDSPEFMKNNGLDRTNRNRLFEDQAFSEKAYAALDAYPVKVDVTDTPHDVAEVNNMFINDAREDPPEWCRISRVAELTEKGVSSALIKKITGLSAPAMSQMKAIYTFPNLLRSLAESHPDKQPILETLATEWVSRLLRPKGADDSLPFSIARMIIYDGKPLHDKPALLVILLSQVMRVEAGKPTGQRYLNMAVAKAELDQLVVQAMAATSSISSEPRAMTLDEMASLVAPQTTPSAPVPVPVSTAAPAPAPVSTGTPAPSKTIPAVTPGLDDGLMQQMTAIDQPDDDDDGVVDLDIQLRDMLASMDSGGVSQQAIAAASGVAAATAASEEGYTPSKPADIMQRAVESMASAKDSAASVVDEGSLTATALYEAVLALVHLQVAEAMFGAVGRREQRTADAEAAKYGDELEAWFEALVSTLDGLLPSDTVEELYQQLPVYCPEEVAEAVV